MKRLCKHKKSRQGWSLIEMTVIISLLGSFSFVGISLINKLMELDTTLATSTYQQLTIDRFADQLRTDADLSTQIDELENGFNLTESTGAVIEYRIQNDVITRRVQRSRRTAHESYRFNDCILNQTITPQQIEFLITKRDSLEDKSMSSQLANQPGQPIRLLLPIGRHLRFAASSTLGEEE